MPAGRRKSKRKSALKKKDYKAMSGGTTENPQMIEPASTTSSDSECLDATILNDCSSCTSCAQLSKVVYQLLSQVAELQKEIISLKEEKKEPVTELATEYQKEFSELKSEIIELQELVEEKTNRQLRQTLVLRDIQERKDEIKWSDTKSVVSKQIAELLDCNEDAAWGMINRCHRGGDKEYYKNQKKHRPIYANLYSWDDCEAIVSAARNAPSVRVDYKYGPKTTIRRNNALKKRKELKQSGEVDQAYVSYPAILMGKKRSEKSYRVIEDFSRMHVELKNRRTKY